MKSDIENKFDDNESVFDRHYSAWAVEGNVFSSKIYAIIIIEI